MSDCGISFGQSAIKSTAKRAVRVDTTAKMRGRAKNGTGCGASNAIRRYLNNRLAHLCDQVASILSARLQDWQIIGSDPFAAGAFDPFQSFVTGGSLEGKIIRSERDCLGCAGGSECLFF